jgi:hypothetical protein
LNWQKLTDAINGGVRVSVALVGFRSSKSRWVDEDTIEVTYMLGRSGLRGVSSVTAYAVGIGRIAFPFIHQGEWIVPQELKSELDVFEDRLKERFGKFIEKLGDEEILSKVIERLSEKMGKSPDEVAEILKTLNAYLVKVEMKVGAMNSGAKMLFEHKYKRHVERHMARAARTVRDLLLTTRKGRKRVIRTAERQLWRLASINQGEHLLELQEALFKALRCAVDYDRGGFPFETLRKYESIPEVKMLLETASKPISWEVI